MKQPFIKTERIVLIANILLVPLIGSICLIVYKNPFYIIWSKDLTEAPLYIFFTLFYFYALIIISIPAYFATVISNSFFKLLIRKKYQINNMLWLLLGLLSGAIVGGVITAIVSGVGGLFKNIFFDMIVIGIVTGAICGILDSLIWLYDIKKKQNNFTYKV